MDKPNFLQFGETRIRLKNIKYYCITQAVVYVHSFDVYKYREKEVSGFFGKRIESYCEFYGKYEITLRDSYINKGVYNDSESFFIEVSDKFFNKDIWVFPVYERPYDEYGSDELIGWIVIKDKDSYDRLIRDFSVDKVYTSEKSNFELIRKEKVDVLNIKTYQNELFEFYQNEVSFDVNNALEQLDKYLLK